MTLRRSTSNFMRFSFSGSCCELFSKCFGQREILLEGILCHVATEWHAVVYYFSCEMGGIFFAIGYPRGAGLDVRQSSDSVQNKVILCGGLIQCVFDNQGFLSTDVCSQTILKITFSLQISTILRCSSQSFERYSWLVKKTYHYPRYRPNCMDNEHFAFMNKLPG